MNTFGQLFRVSIYGESHGPAVGVLLDGVPPGTPVDVADFEPDLARRRGGQGKGTTPRREADVPRIASGVFNGHATGSPMLLEFENANVISTHYDAVLDTPRPGHADLVAMQKFGGFADLRGGGHFSGRLTTGIVAAGVVAKRLVPGSITATLLEVGGSTDIATVVEQALRDGDSVGGIVECRVTGIPAGLGEPFFDAAESLLAHAMFAIPAIKGVEFGAGFAAARMTGTEHNDDIVDISGTTATNHAGGINGGITNGNEIVFRVAVKPTSSVRKNQLTVNLSTGCRTNVSIRGRHDACIALRVPVVVEAMTAIVLTDLAMRHRAADLDTKNNERPPLIN